MKKQYIEPNMAIGAGVLGEDVLEGPGINPGSVEEQLGKERNDDFDNNIEEKDSWQGGLW